MCTVIRKYFYFRVPKIHLSCARKNRYLILSDFLKCLFYSMHLKLLDSRLPNIILSQIFGKNEKKKIFLAWGIRTR